MSPWWLLLEEFSGGIYARDKRKVLEVVGVDDTGENKFNADVEICKFSVKIDKQ